VDPLLAQKLASDLMKSPLHTGLVSSIIEEIVPQLVNTFESQLPKRPLSSVPNPLYSRESHSNGMSQYPPLGGSFHGLPRGSMITQSSWESECSSAISLRLIADSHSFRYDELTLRNTFP
jgi:hypothetical protein